MFWASPGSSQFLFLKIYHHENRQRVLLPFIPSKINTFASRCVFGSILNFKSNVVVCWNYNLATPRESTSTYFRAASYRGCTHKQPSGCRTRRPSGSCNGCARCPCRRTAARSRTAPGWGCRWCTWRSGRRPQGVRSSAHRTAQGNPAGPAPADCALQNTVILITTEEI